MTYIHYLPSLPLGEWVEKVFNYISGQWASFFDFISAFIESFVNGIVNGFDYVHPFLFIIILAAIAWWRAGWGVGIFTLLGMYLIFNMGYWADTIQTFSLILTSVIISIIIGIPVGIWIGLNDWAKRIITPILDFMQTMPAFVYLIPTIILFGIGMAPGVIATVIFAMPPTIRLTGLGIRQVPEDLMEAAQSFGSTTSQKLFKVQLPLSVNTIMAGVNQSIMLALSMVVIASLVGAPGLGRKVYYAVTQLQIGIGAESGLAIVILAIILDRISQNIRRKR